MRTVDQFDFEGKKALVRVDFNVPLDEKRNITDDTRIQAALPTIEKILNDGGAVILMSHLGRPKGKRNEEYSMQPVAQHLEKVLGRKVQFANDCRGEEVREQARNLKPGEVLLLENLRFYNEEEAGDEEFAKELSELADVYVNDAFGTAHRAHASTTIVARYFDNKVFGKLMAQEVESIEKVLTQAERPFTAIVGGAKVSDKVGIIENLLEKADNVIVGGAMAYTFLKAKGEQVGKSRVEEEKLDLARKLMEKAKTKGVNLLLPVDSLVAGEFKEDAETAVEPSGNISGDKMGLDVGPEARKAFGEVIRNSRTILWNGPMGVFEWERFAEGTKAIAEAVKDATQKGAYSLVGGGDSVAAVKQLGYEPYISYISTGGGAMLEALEGTTLPGVGAIKSELTV